MTTAIMSRVAACVLAVGLAPVSTALAQAPPLVQECSSASNGGTLTNGVCVLPGALAGGANDYYGYIIANNGESSDTFAVVSGNLPPGLSMPSHYGVADTLIYGVATRTGTFTFVVKATDADDRTSSLQTYSITVSSPPPDKLVCSPGDNGGTLVNGVCVLPDAAVGQNYEGFIITSNNSGGSFSIISGSLPPGMSMPSSYGASGTIVAGTPTRQGTSTFTVKGTDQEGQPLQQTYSIKVGPPLPLVITSGSCCASSPAGTPYGVNFFADGGVQPLVWSIASGQVPPGLSLCASPPASLDGTPTTAGTFAFAVRVTDSQGSQATEPASITILPSSSTPDSVALSPACVRGGLTSTGTVRLSSPAPSGGTVVSLSSDHTSYATVPSSVTVPAGATSTNFTVNTQPLSLGETVTIGAIFDGQYFSAGLTITPS
jgi:large repetitive protein